MKISDVERFFKELDRRAKTPLQIILTGGAAAIVMGVKRVTQDIDFEVELKAGPNRLDAWDAVQKHIADTATATGITPQFSEDIDRWSSIAMPFKKSRPWKKMGHVDVRILEPSLWAIGKLSRYLATDEKDLVTVFQLIKPDLKAVVNTWGKALGKSPASSAQPTFRKHVELFFQENGRKIWGKKFDAASVFESFLAVARKAASGA